MSPVSEDDIRAILVSLARIEERQEASAHRVRNMDMKLDGCLRRADLDPILERIKPLEARVGKLEGFQTWVYRSAGTVGLAVLGGLAYLGRKMGGSS
jgi:hypothetical protein